MSGLFEQILDRCKPREGWVPFLLTLIAIACLPVALVEVSKDLSATGLAVLTVLAIAIARRVSRSQLSGRLAAIVAGPLGAVLVGILIGQMIPPLSLLWHQASYSIGWLGQAVAGEPPMPLPFALVVAFVWQQVEGLGTRLWWWTQTVASGGVAQDTIVLEMITMALLWLLTFFATWQIHRHRSVLVGLLPSGAALAILSFFAGDMATFYLAVYLVCTLSLLGSTRLALQTEHWERASIDYPGGLGMELAFTLATSLAVVLALAIIVPVVHPRQIRDAFWAVMDAPWHQLEQASERIFGPIPGSGAGSGRRGGILPRQHLLGQSPDLAETVAFYVTTDDPPPVPDLDGPATIDPTTSIRYWRSLTYDTYTGQGWINGPLVQRAVPAGQPLGQELPSRPELRQQFDLAAQESPLLYAANAPLRVDRPVRVWWRAPDDLAHLSSETDRYTVISRPPNPTAGDLVLAPPTLPPELGERYLALPDDLPRRVGDLTREVVAGAETRYDQARAIESFLRTYTYTLELPPFPANRDLVDYFLFELQEGYCDYFASAMVVMARTAGIPARLATGYAQGTFDHESGRWVVSEADGHSWVEIYFAGAGWVEFEPTAGRAALVRPGARSSGLSVPPVPPRTPSRAQMPWAVLVWAGALTLLVVTVLFRWQRWRGEAALGADLVRDRYQRMVHWGERLGQPLRDGQTAFEYGAILGENLAARGLGSRWARVRQASNKAPAEVEHLAETYVRAQYGQNPISEKESRQVRELWARLHRLLKWLWIAGR